MSKDTESPDTVAEYFVDLPIYSGEFQEVASFYTEHEAIAYCMKKWGADHLGMICLITPNPTE
jgi:hypothetical protein